MNVDPATLSERELGSRGVARLIVAAPADRAVVVRHAVAGVVVARIGPPTTRDGRICAGRAIDGDAPRATTACKHDCA